jgi:phage major head subunit gpT-like protein
MVITDPAESLDLGFIGQMPSVRKWIGNRVINNLVKKGLTVAPDPFELTIGVKVSELETDRLGLIRPRIQDMTSEMAKHPERLFIDLLAKGFENLCWDGQYFFDTDHPVEVNGTVQSVSNMSTAEFSAEALAAALSEMSSLVRDGDGEPLEIGATDLVVPPQLYDAALRAVNADIIEGTTNVRKGVVKVHVAKRLAKYPTRWFLLDCSREIRGIVVQVAKTPVFVAMDAPEDEARFMQSECRYGVDAKYGAGYGLWQLAWGSTGAGES